MRVLLATDTFCPTINGVSVFTACLAQSLSRYGDVVSIVAPSPPRALSSDKYETHHTVWVPSIPVWIHPHLRATPFLSFRSARAILTTLRPDIVHIQTPGFIGTALSRAACATGIPCVATHHIRPDNFAPYLPRLVTGGFDALYWCHIRWVYRHLRAVASPSRTAVEMIEKRVLGLDTIVIPNGVDAERFRPPQGGPTLQWRNRTVMYVGRLDRDKNLQFLAVAMRHLLAAGPCRVVFVGDGSEASMLHDVLGENERAARVTFVGAVEHGDIDRWYKAATVFVTASRSETLSLAMLEALCCGVPVVALRSPEMEQVVEDGVNGLLVDEEAAGRFSESVMAIVNDSELHSRLSRGARATGVGLYSLPETVARYRSLYCRAMSGEPR